MIYLVDTNVLLRSVQADDPTYETARRSAALLIHRGNQLSIVAQNLIEFWAVATRPLVNNGLGLSIPETVAHITSFKETFKLLPDMPEIFPEWEGLVVVHAVSGRQVHDARLVAAMLAHNVTHLLTFNGGDFKRYNEITAVNPHDAMEN